MCFCKTIYLTLLSLINSHCIMFVATSPTYSLLTSLLTGFLRHWRNRVI
uniref:Uncharacterized protein n=1 Tax=Aegilops tauschii subsp. strangulata TaxID=200361 RepID=A0A453S9E4_AEGTS